MSRSFVMEPWVLMKGSENNTAEVVQPDDGWVNTGDALHAVIEARCLASTNCTLAVETAVNPGGTWTALLSLAATGTTVVYADTEGAAGTKLQQWMRWKITPGGANWQTCFLVNVALK